ncbi:MAG: bacteriohemerythrin [Gammaproteobacteria bacterium]|jgi:hemerythrin-like metal-binding protein
MPLIAWSEEFDVHVVEMNEQHKTLINMMNELYQLNKNGEPKPQILGRMNSFFDFARWHFAAEESYMESIGYDGLRNHAVIHRALLTTLSQLIDEYKTCCANVPDKFFVFLNKWLVSHIKGMDKKYGEYASEYPHAVSA